MRLAIALTGVLIGCLVALAGRPTIVAERIVFCAASWNTTFSNGNALQRVEDTCVKPGRYQRKYALSPAFWSRLDDEMKTVAFQELPRDIDQKPDTRGNIVIVPDDDLLCITVHKLAKKQKVCGTATDIELTDEGRRFSRVWSILTREAPEPVHK